MRRDPRQRSLTLSPSSSGEKPFRSAYATDVRDAGCVRYIGSKARVVHEIAEIIGSPREDAGHFVDAFCGTGIVAESAANLGWPIRLNDHLLSSAALAAARLLAREDVPFAELGGYDNVIDRINAAEPVRGFFWREYSPASGPGRMYFSEKNAARIDAVRSMLRSWLLMGQLTADESALLTADLIVAAARVANIAGTYGYFMAHWTGAAKRNLVFEPRTLRAEPVEHEVFCRDVVDVPMARRDLAYFDPPYTKRQYAAYYHINETLAHGDAPDLIGKSGLRPWREKSSDYCYKSRALGALTELISNTAAHRVLLSYSSEGHVRLDDLAEAIAPLGELEIHELGPIGRYRPNQAARNAAGAVIEYVVDLQRTESLDEEAELVG